MWHWFKKKKLQSSKGIEVKESSIHGRGVFACNTIKAGAVIEIAPVILLEKAERDFLQTTALFGYYFVVADENTPVALGLGYTSLYNHSYNANAIYSVSIQNKTITVKACKTIHQGNEITLNYNGHPEDSTPVYFPPEENIV